MRLQALNGSTCLSGIIIIIKKKRKYVYIELLSNDFLLFSFISFLPSLAGGGLCFLGSERGGLPVLLSGAEGQPFASLPG